ncbi:NPC intracellular cholesterol transporter 2-like [Littorina saxatilis]|uniref:MD-2-related lipid-recognition domain-containing protein n=1 Tax=Littorina saxatilis TaxID=31220 RepID=A0AAN9BCU5_9CAEN
MERLLVFACVVVTAVAVPITFKECISTGGEGQVKSVDISPCPVQPCVFTKNVTATVKVTFTAPQDSGSLKAQIYGIIEGIKVGWAMPDPDGCHSNITCPVTGGNVYTYTSTLGVPKGAPKLRLVVEWSLTGSKGEKQFCFDFPMEIS